MNCLSYHNIEEAFSALRHVAQQINRLCGLYSSAQNKIKQGHFSSFVKTIKRNSNQKETQLMLEPIVTKRNLSRHLTVVTPFSSPAVATSTVPNACRPEVTVLNRINHLIWLFSSLADMCKKVLSNSIPFSVLNISALWVNLLITLPANDVSDRVYAAKGDAYRPLTFQHLPQPDPSILLFLSQKKTAAATTTTTTNKYSDTKGLNYYSQLQWHWLKALNSLEYVLVIIIKATCIP